jgi:hypothetical protein
MRRLPAVIAVALTLVVGLTLVVVVTAGGGGDEEATTTPAPAEAPSRTATPPSAAGLQLPPGIAECLADQGFAVDPSELHSVPPQVLNECFQALHQGGGAP